MASHVTSITLVRALLAACVAVSLCDATPSRAQVLLEGRVLDDVSEEPLAGARVILLNRYNRTAGYAVTDALGQFRFEDRDWGWYRLEITAVGYVRAQTPFLWWTNEHEFAGLEVRLAPDAVLLAPLEIVALSERNVSPILDNAEFRSTRGFGVHITREQIERRRPANVTDMLVEVPGVYASRSGVGASGGRHLYMGRALPGLGGGDCPVQVWLDGVLASRDGPVIIDDLVNPLDVEMVEIFRGLGTIPPEFLNTDARCGVVAIWTRRSLEVRP
ncbi:MAG: carboxypeptidase regulatory-like domain-containing protein [Gemmatimonadota bacterium]|nr:MAG: carboxypeptidase regulatory-like domain-containing protein [Gemmatimonadota bacterium]